MRATLSLSLSTSAVLASNLGAAAGNSSIKKVVTLLEDMKAKVTAETEQGAKDAEEYADWCIKAIAETTADVKYGSEKVEELQAAAEDGAARADGAAAEAATLALEIGKSQAAQKKAAEERKEAHKAFTSEEAELVEADTMLGKAYSVLKRSLSLAQVDGAQSGEVKKTEEVVAALGAIIDSAAIDVENTATIKSFLEQPQASVKNYESKSGGILTAIQGMQEKNADLLGKLREKEMGGRHKFELLMQDLKNTETSKGEQMDQQKEMGAKAEAAGKEAAANGAAAADTLAADKKELSETKQGCEKAAKDWTARSEEAAAEISTIQQAVEILSGKFGTEEPAAEAFVQIKNKEMSSAEFNRRERAAKLLRSLGREFNQYGLVQVAARAQDDPFVKVRGMIDEMITKLEEEQRKEASKEAKCKADKAKGEKDLKIKKADYNKLMARSDAAAAKFTTLGEEIKDLKTQLKELATSVKAATKMRNTENADNTATIKDAAESIEALTGAITVLQDFYGGGETAAFVQLSAKVDATKQTDTASVIVAMLQTAQEDFEKLKQETESAESSAADKYDKDMQAAEVAKAKKTAMVEGKTNERSAVKVQASQIEEDLGNATKALDAANTFLKEVKESCANKAMSFEEKQKRRADEIAGLREALEILAPEGEFVQVKSFMGKSQ